MNVNYCDGTVRNFLNDPGELIKYVPALSFKTKQLQGRNFTQTFTQEFPEGQIRITRFGKYENVECVLNITQPIKQLFTVKLGFTVDLIDTSNVVVTLANYITGTSGTVGSSGINATSGFFYQSWNVVSGKRKEIVVTQGQYNILKNYILNFSANGIIGSSGTTVLQGSIEKLVGEYEYKYTGTTGTSGTADTSGVNPTLTITTSSGKGWVNVWEYYLVIYSTDNQGNTIITVSFVESLVQISGHGTYQVTWSVDQRYWSPYRYYRSSSTFIGYNKTVSFKPFTTDLPYPVASGTSGTSGTSGSIYSFIKIKSYPILYNPQP